MMKRFCLMVLLACEGLLCGHVYGYLPEMDSTGLCTFNRALLIRGLTGTGNSDGVIDVTDATGYTPISFTWRNPETGELQAVSWSGKVWRYSFDPFFNCDHMYDIKLSGDGLSLEIKVDGGRYVLTGVLSDRDGDYRTASSAWEMGRTLRGKASSSGGVLGLFEIKCGRVGKSGTAKVSATLTGVDGKKKNYKAQSVRVSGGVAEVSWPLSDGQSLNVTINESTFSGTGGGMSVQTAAVGGVAAFDVLLFTVSNVSLAVPNGFQLLDVGSLYGWGGGQPVYVNRSTGTWKCGNIVSANYVKYREGSKKTLCCDVKSGQYYLNILCDCSAENRIGLALHYAPSKGTFKGSFRLYAIRTDGSRSIKKYKANVTGVWVDGKGYGQATCKNPAGGPWPVTVE